jgi:hypothetical protein
MENLPRQPEVIASIQREIDAYSAYEDETRRVYAKEEECEDRINRAVRKLVGQADVVKKADAFIGKTVWYCAGGSAAFRRGTTESRVYILKVEKVVYKKWEVAFIGTGHEICSPKQTYASSGFSIKNVDLKEALDANWITENPETPTAFIEAITKACEEEVKLATDHIRAHYGETIDALKGFLNGEVAPKERPTLRLHRADLHQDQVMEHVCEISWSDLVRAFGSDEQKEKIGPELVDSVDA